MWRVWRQHRGKVAGGLFGLVIAILLIVAWPIVLIVFLVLCGVAIGAFWDVTRRLGRILDRVVEVGERATGVGREQSKKDQRSSDR